MQPQQAVGTLMQHWKSPFHLMLIRYVKLEKLNDDHPGIDELTVLCAKGLFNLRNKQSDDDAKETDKKLRDLIIIMIDSHTFN